jgi:hypothetical protein
LLDVVTRARDASGQKFQEGCDMNRPEYSLSLDSVICRRCNFVSPAEEDSCPSCGADRQGAIFTSVADTAPSAPVPAPLDILDWDDSHWLQRLVRRRMLTSYPNFIEPGDMPDGEQRKPSRTGLAVLIGGVVASIAAGGYFYTHLDENSVPSSVEPGISVAGSIGDGASAVSAVDNARHASLARARADATTTTRAALPASSPVAQVSRTPERADAVAARAPAQTAPVTVRATPSVAVASAPKPATPAAPVVVAAANAPSQDITASVAAAPSVKPVQKPETRVEASVPAKAVPQTPVIASAQKTETHAEASVPAKAVLQTPAIASAPKSEAHPEVYTSANAVPQTAQKTETRADASLPAKPARQANVATKPVTQQTSPTPKPTIASLEKPAAPAPAPIAEPPPAYVAHSIASVQQALAMRDLTSARRHMRGLYASLPRSPEIQQLAADLSRQERARDGAIANARSCTADKDAACALRHARRAVALDPRNGQAQATLRRALAVQNETNTEYFRQASAIPKPVVPAMTFDGRWSAGSRHGAASADGDASNFTLFGLGVPAVAKGRGDAH